MNGAKVLLCLAALGAAVQNDALAKLKTMMAEMQDDIEKEMASTKKNCGETLCLLHANKVDDEISRDNTRIALKKATAAHAAHKAAKEKFTTEVNRMTAEKRQAQKDLDDARNMRESEQREYQKESQELLTNIPMVKGALQRLQKKSFLQTHPMKPAQVEKIQAMLQEQSSDAATDFSSLMQMGTGNSDVVVGILSQMLEDMQERQKTADAEEKQKGANYGTVRANLRKEIDASSDMLYENREGLAESAQALTKATIDRDNNQKMLDELIQSLEENAATTSQTRKDCDATKMKLGADHKAIIEATGIISDGSLTFAAAGSFIQLVARKFESMAAKSNNDAYVQMAARLRAGGVFDKVFEVIDKLQAKLKEDQTSDNNDKADCEDSLNTMRQEERDLKNEKNRLATTKDKQDSTIATATEEIDQAQKAMADLKMKMQKTGEQRSKHNKEFQTSFDNNVAAMSVVKMAKDRMEKRFGSNGAIVLMMHEIITDMEGTNKQEQAQEADEYEAYNRFIADSNEQLNSLQQGIDENGALQDATQAQFQTTSNELSATKTQHGEKKGELNRKEGDCKFILDNHGTRKASRSAEAQGLVEAKAMLKGMEG